MVEEFEPIEPEIPDEEVKEDLLAIRKSFIERLVDEPQKIVEAMEKMVKLLEQLRIASIKATYPTDWVVHKSLETGLALAYLQDHGAERAGKPWGIVLRKPAYDKEDFSDGTYIYFCRSPLAYSRRTGEFVENIEGARWSGQLFFQRRLGPEEKVNPLHVKQSAYRNLHGKVVRTLGGLGSIPVNVLREAGLKVEECIWVEYAKKGQEYPKKGPPPSKDNPRGEAWTLLEKQGEGMKGAIDLLKQLTGKTAMTDLNDKEVSELLYLLKERERVPSKPEQEKLI